MEKSEMSKAFRFFLNIDFWLFLQQEREFPLQH